jgi:hypothetical protein
MPSTRRTATPPGILLGLAVVLALLGSLASPTIYAQPQRAPASNAPSLTLKGVSDGQVVSGRVVIEAAVSGSDIAKVEFRLDGAKPAIHTERLAPYYFMGDSGGKPTGWDTTQFPNGEHRLTVTAVTRSGQSSAVAVRLQIGNGASAPPAPTATAQATAIPPTATAQPTAVPPTATATPGSIGAPASTTIRGVSDGQVVSGRVAIERVASGDIAKVEFRLDGAKPAIHTEWMAPYYFMGDSGGKPTGWDTTQFPNGEYRLTVTTFMRNGQSGAETLRLQVGNGASPPQAATATSTAQPSAVPPTPTAQPSAVPPTATPAAGGAPKLLFGMGPTASGALETQLVREAPVRMLTTWFNGTKDLAWMNYWRTGTIPRSYQSGYALHVIVYTNDPETTVSTPYGPGCGRPYAISDAFASDMQQLAQIFAGAANGPPLYVTLFTEFQTYPCNDNAWNPNAQTNNYLKALKDSYREAAGIIRQNAPNARVSLGWGGWQARFDQPAIGGGRSMFQHFADVMRESDFQSFQAMQSDSNVQDVRAMVNVLNDYGPVMLAHYKPDSGSQPTFEADVRAMLTDAYLAELTAAGLFGWSFMDNKNLAASPAIYEFVRGAVQRYGRAP